MITTQVLTSDDWPVWRELRLAALGDAPYAFGSRLADWQGDGDREERWRARLDTPGHHVLALLDEQPAGMASGVPGDRDDVVHLISLWVRPEARGQGVGDHLMRVVERWARQVRATELRLQVRPDNAPAFALYRRHAFQDTGPCGRPLHDGRREHVMVKALPR